MGCRESTESKEGMESVLETARNQIQGDSAKMSQQDDEIKKLKAELQAMKEGQSAPGEFSTNDLQRIEDLQRQMSIGSPSVSVNARKSAGDAALAAQLLEREKEIQQLRTQVSNLTARLESSGGDVAMKAYYLEQECERLRQQLSGVSQTAASATCEVDVQRRRADGVTEQLAVREASLRNMEAECSALKSDVMLLRGKLADADAVRMTLQRQLDDSKAELHTTKSSVTVESASLSADRDRHAKKVLNLEQQLQETQSTLQEARQAEEDARAQAQSTAANLKATAERLRELEDSAANTQRDAILLKSLIQLVVGPKCSDDTLGRSIVSIACESAGLATRVGWRRSDVAMRSLRFTDVPFGDSIAALSAMVLRRNPNLSTIELGASSMTDLGAGELAIAITLTRNNLQGVYLGQNCVTLQGAKWLVNACLTISQAFELDMSNNPITAASASTPPPSAQDVQALMADVRELRQRRPNVSVEIDNI